MWRCCTRWRGCGRGARRRSDRRVPACSEVALDLAPMADRQHPDDELAVLDGVDGSVAAHAEAAHGSVDRPEECRHLLHGH